MFSVVQKLQRLLMLTPCYGTTDPTRVVTANTMLSAAHTLPGLLMLTPCYGSTDLTRNFTANSMFSAFQSLHYVQYVTQAKPIHSEFTTVNSPLNPLCYFRILPNLHFIFYTNYLHFSIL